MSKPANDEIPAFRSDEIQRVYNDVKRELHEGVVKVYRDGYSDGYDQARLEFIKRLQEYGKDSAIAKLIAEIVEAERIAEL